MPNYIQINEPSILKKLAEALGTQLKNRRLEIPKKFGKGYCLEYIFNQHIRMLILNYELDKNITVENPDADLSTQMLIFKFQNIFPKIEKLSTEGHLTRTPSVLIATKRMNADTVIPIHSNTSTINIQVDANYLKELFEFSEKSQTLQGLLNNTQPLLFEQLIYPSLQKIVDEILYESVGDTFKLFFLRVKAEELVCKLLIELEKREEKQLYALNELDIQTIYKVKNQLLQNIEKNPSIDELSSISNMSPTKLKRLFKQIFGDSIFSYYQNFRIQEASRLLREKKFTVSEVGYKVGFTNLGHFSKVFEEHIGMKPKKYSSSI